MRRATKPLAPMRREQLIIGWVLVGLGGIGLVPVLVEYPHWWALGVAAGSVSGIAGLWYVLALRPGRKRLATAPLVPPEAQVETNRQLYRREAINTLILLVAVVAAVAAGIDGGGLLSPVGFSGLGIATLVHARWLGRTERAHNATFFRERKLFARGSPFLFRLPH